MNRSAWSVLVWLCPVFGLLAGCLGGTETGNPSFQGSLGYDAYTSAPTVVALPSALTQQPDAATAEPMATHLKTTWLVLGDVGFVSQARCDAADAVQHALGIGAGDHVGSQAPPTDFELSSGLYCGVSLPLILSAQAPAKGPAALTGHSMLIQGTLRDGRAFQLLSAMRAQLFLRSSAAGFELDEQRSGVLIGFDVASWLDALALDGAQTDASGMVLIDAQHNSDLLTSFEQHVPSGIALFRDLDRDGLLDANPQQLARGSD